jgi:hypothetical protein
MRPAYLSQGYGWPTTRKHPRSMAEAFPLDHAMAIEHHPSPKSWLLSDICIAVICLAVLLAIAFGVFA